MIRSVIPALAAGAGICFIGYCIYFDRKRRSAPDFREKLRKSKICLAFLSLISERQQQALEAKKALAIQLPPPTDPGAMHKFFLEQIQQAEVALAMGAIEEGVQHFAIAVAVCGQPTQLLSVLQQSLSPAVFGMLMEALPSVRTQILGSVANLHVAREIEEELE